MGHVYSSYRGEPFGAFFSPALHGRLRPRRPAEFPYLSVAQTQARTDVFVLATPSGIPGAPRRLPPLRRDDGYQPVVNFDITRRQRTVMNA